MGLLTCLEVGWKSSDLIWAKLEWLSFTCFSSSYWKEQVSLGKFFSWSWQKHKSINPKHASTFWLYTCVMLTDHWPKQIAGSKSEWRWGREQWTNRLQKWGEQRDYFSAVIYNNKTYKIIVWRQRNTKLTWDLRRYAFWEIFIHLVLFLSTWKDGQLHYSLWKCKAKP